MHEFDKFGHDYQAKLEGSIRGVGTLDSALKSKLHVLRTVVASNQGQANERILDFGCGVGLLSGALAELSSNVTGVDVSLDSLRHSVTGQGMFVLFDGQSLPFPGNSFDLVVVSCVIHHIPPESRAGILKEIRRVLMPGGVLVVIEHNPYNPVTRLVVNRCEFDRDAELLSMSAMKRLLEGGNFEKFQHGYFYAIPPVNDTWSFIDSWFSRIPIGAQYYCAYRKAQ